jgi:hypothetical protein
MDFLHVRRRQHTGLMDSPRLTITEIWHGYDRDAVIVTSGTLTSTPARDTRRCGAEASWSAASVSP